MEFMAKPAVGCLLVESGASKTDKVVETLKQSLPELIRGSAGPLQLLPNGELVHVDWPHAGFFPHAMSTDNVGRQIVFVDDIGLYLGQVIQGSQRGLPRGGASFKESSGNTSEVGYAEAGTIHASNFRRVAPCATLGSPGMRGAELMDMSLSCVPWSRGAEASLCRIFVLSENGQRLVECTLPSQVGRNRSSQATGVVDHGADPEAKSQQSQSWRISSNWLHQEGQGERIKSMAVNGECFRSDIGESSGAYTFDAAGLGCVVIGTTFGRIVQLRGSLSDERTLVPDRSLYQRREAVGRGSLHVLGSGLVLALQPKSFASMNSHAAFQAFSGPEGALVGQWQLPDSTEWLSFSSGGSDLFALGLQHGRLRLYSFPVPSELRVL